MKKRIVLLILALVCLAIPAFVVFALPTIQSLKVDIPEYQKPGDLVLLEQGWKAAQRTSFHYTAQGTQIMPYQWFIALERPCWWPFGCGKFADQEYLGRFGFIAGVKDDKLNPAALPVGFAIDTQFRNPITGNTAPILGLNCAACHTGELQYQNHAVRIEGGPAMTNLDQFLNAIGVALLMTKNMPFRYSRFESNVLGPAATASEKVALRQEFNAFLDGSANEVNQGNQRGVYNVTEGFGRTDALARIGNIVFAVDMNNWNNLSPTNAPVRFPQVWDASWFTWVQYNASISNPMARNVGEALGVKAAAKLQGCCATKLQSTVLFEEVWFLEKLLSGPAPYQGLTSPKWPAVFPPLDAAKVARGKDLYRDHCMKCHLPPPDELLDDLKTKRVYWEMRDGTHPFLKVKEIPIEAIGTDPNQALDFYNRTADSGDLKKGCLTAAEGLDAICRTMALNFYTEQKFPPAVQREWSGYQDPNAVGIRATKVYRPRPLNGVWALGTYLHNGSVPNLYDLLSPHGERPAVFWVGGKKFDPVKVGYEATEFPGAFRYDVTQPGSSNRGHEFSNDSGSGVIGKLLSPDDRYAIIEYLKSL
jgi:hypothetical protein